MDALIKSARVGPAIIRVLLKALIEQEYVVYCKEK